MKRLIAIGLLALYLFGTTEACQLLKLPFLFSHFIEHKEHHNSSITFIEFLAMHYDGESQSGNNDHQSNDDRLPFKTIDDCCITAYTTLPVACISFQSPVYRLNPSPVPVKNSSNYIYTYTEDIFQPPRS